MGIIAIILFSSAIYYCERGAWDEAQREWWRDDEVSAGTGGRFEMMTACNGTVTAVDETVSGGSGSLGLELVDFEAGSDGRGWVPKLVFDFVEFPTGYIEEGSGVAWREQAGTITATYTDNRAAGVAPPTAEAVRSAMEVVPVWAVHSICRAHQVDSDSQASWEPSGEWEDCNGGNTYSDGMGAKPSDEDRAKFPATGKEAIAGTGSDL